MGLSAFYPPHPTKEEGIKVIHRALELGCNFFDTADLYGFGVNEELLGEAIRTANVKRSEVVIATKFAFILNPDKSIGVCGKPEHVKESCAKSLKRLGLDYIDLYYQHRVDPKTPIEETVHAMAELVKEGKVKYLGLSECSAETLRKAHKIHPITACQVEYSLFTTDIEENGILSTCKELGITLVAYSPLSRGFLTGQIKSYDDLEPNDWRRDAPRFKPENFSKNLDLVKLLEAIAKEKNCTTGQLALAWVIAQQNVVAIPGTKKIQYLEENMAAEKVHLSEDDMKKIREILKSFNVAGMRYPEGSMKAVNL